MLMVTPLLIRLLLMSRFDTATIIFNKPKVNYIRTNTSQKAQKTYLNQQTPFKMKPNPIISC